MILGLTALTILSHDRPHGRGKVVTVIQPTAESLDLIEHYVDGQIFDSVVLVDHSAGLLSHCDEWAQSFRLSNARRVDSALTIWQLYLEYVNA